jgi:predicted dinucleotide-binding enzyme
MKIGIIGAGRIGQTVATRLVSAGHDVRAQYPPSMVNVDPATLALATRAAIETLLTKRQR